MSSRLKIGVIGAGRIGRVHANNLAHHVGEATPAAIADIDPAAAREVAAECHIPSVFADAGELLNDPELDAVLICSWADTHAELTMRAAQAGKHVFCEKPIDLDIAKTREVLRVVERAGVKLQVGFNRRFDPNFSRIKHEITAGEIGQPHLLRISSRDPAPPSIEYLRNSGGIFTDMTIHDFDMARFLMGEVEEVYATGAVLIDPEIAKIGDTDTVLVQLKFSNRALGTIDNSRQAVYGYDQRVEVFGSKGMAQANNVTLDSVAISNAESVRSAKPRYFFLERYLDAYIAELLAFVRCIQEDEAPPVSGKDGYMALKIALAAKQSLSESRPVSLADFDEEADM